LSTLTNNEIGGYEAPTASASDRVQVFLGGDSVQFQPVPLMLVAVRPVGTRSASVTVPEVTAFPLLVTVMVKANGRPRVAVPFMGVMPTAPISQAWAGCVASSISATLSGMPTPSAARDVRIALPTR